MYILKSLFLPHKPQLPNKELDTSLREAMEQYICSDTELCVHALQIKLFVVLPPRYSRNLNLAFKSLNVPPLEEIHILQYDVTIYEVKYGRLKTGSYKLALLFASIRIKINKTYDECTFCSRCGVAPFFLLFPTTSYTSDLLCVVFDIGLCFNRYLSNNPP